MHCLFVTTSPPWPPRRGFQMRLDGLASELVERHRVSVLAQRFPGFSAAPAPPGVALELYDVSRTESLAGLLAWRRLPLQVALYSPPGFAAAVARTVDRLAPDVVVLVLSRVGIAADAVDGPLVVDLVDSLALNMEQRAARQPWLRPLLRWEARRVLAWDRRLIERAAAVTVVSERDRASLLGDGHGARAGKVRVIPVGVRRPMLETWPPRRRAVLLAGNLGYFPTVDGALWFLDDVWPRVRSTVSDAEMWLAGSRPDRRLRRFAGHHGVRLFVEPGDLGELRRTAAVAVAPLRAGSGTPIKILEAMADRTPVVTTTLGAAGLDALGGNELLLADRADDFAVAVSRLMTERGLADQQAAAAERWLAARHDLERTGRAFETVLREAVEGTPPKACREEGAS